MHKQQFNINLDLNTLQQVECPVCTNKFFFPLMTLRNVSALQSPVGKAGIIFVQQGFACTACGQHIDPQQEIMKKEAESSEEAKVIEVH